MNLLAALAALLAFSITTLWAPARWALSGVEAGSFALAGIAVWRARFRFPPIVLVPVFMSAWAAIQVVAHWTSVPAATGAASLYWLAAACLVLLGAYVGDSALRERFLSFLLATGTMICVAGIIQLFTSNGNVFWLFPSGFDRRVIGPFVSPNNYAAFVELLVPVALTRRTVWRLPAAAALAATVAAGGSRAGTIVVIAEIAAVLVIERRKLPEFAIFAVLAALCAAVFGYQFLWARFFQSDPFAIRREFLQSTLAMFRAQPFHGLGLGTWPWTYPRFATIDTGEFANHSHNEWAQWAAEGGAPAIAAMLALLVWIVPRAFRRPWAVGLFAVLIHSAVDYPFLRLGLSAWFFVLTGLLAGAQTQFSAGGWRFGGARTAFFGRIAVSFLLLAGIWQAARLAFADALYRRLTPISVERAARISNEADYHFALAQLDAQHVRWHLEAALEANPNDTRSRIALAQERESSGAMGPAEGLLLGAAERDRQFAPAWALANFYFRRQSTDDFWRWTRRAASVSFGGRRALFDLCLLAAPEPEEVFDRIGNPQLEEAFLRYLVARHGAVSASGFALRLAQRRSLSESALLDYVDEAIVEGQVEAAWQVWNLLAAHAPGRGFDWRVQQTHGVYISRRGDVWHVELSGLHPESCELLKRAAPDGRYILRYEYRTEGLSAVTGLFWDAAPIPPSMEWRKAEAPAAGNWLTLAYHRPLGEMRAAGVLWLRNLRLETAPTALFKAAKAADKGSGCCN
jgi:O-antigen ligase